MADEPEETTPDVTAGASTEAPAADVVAETTTTTPTPTPEPETPAAAEPAVAATAPAAAAPLSCSCSDPCARTRPGQEGRPGGRRRHAPEPPQGA